MERLHLDTMDLSMGHTNVNAILDADKANIAHVPCCSRTLIVMFVGIVLQFVHNC